MTERRCVIFHYNKLSENVQDIRQSHEVHRGNHENWKMELTGGKNLTAVKIQRGIFHYLL